MFSEHMHDLLRETPEDVEEPPRELTVEEAVDLAIVVQQNDQLAEAEVIYRQIFAVDPENPRALHFAGVLAHHARQAELHDPPPPAPGYDPQTLGVLFGRPL